MAALPRHLLLSLVVLLSAGICFAQECLYGFPSDVLPAGNGDQPHLLGGSYLFPNITIQCSGRVTSVTFSGYFNPDIRYNSTLTMQVLFYSLTGTQYMLETGTNLILNLNAYLQTRPSLMIMTDANGRYYVSQPLVVSLAATLNTPLQVLPGYVLGISLPPTEQLGVVSRAVSLAVLEDANSPSISTSLSSCWNPTERTSEPCSVITGLQRPVVLVNFTEEATTPPPAPSSTATTQPSSTPQPPARDTEPSAQIGASTYYAAAGMAGLFAILFVLFAILALVLVCVLIAISRRSSKSVTVSATGLGPRHQQVAVTTINASNAELGYEMMNSAGNGSGYDYPHKVDSEAYQAVTVPEGRYETLECSTKERPSSAYNHLHRPPPPTHAQYSVPRGVSPPTEYRQLSVQAQYTNMQQSPSQPPSGAATDVGPGNEYATVLQ